MRSVSVDVSIVFLVLALSRTVLVLDGVLEFHGFGGMVYRISSCLRWMRSSPHENLESLGDAAARESHSNGTDSRRTSRWVINRVGNGSLQYLSNIVVEASPENSSVSKRA